jgi:hypothetical protein
MRFLCPFLHALIRNAAELRFLCPFLHVLIRNAAELSLSEEFEVADICVPFLAGFQLSRVLGFTLRERKSESSSVGLPFPCRRR